MRDIKFRVWDGEKIVSISRALFNDSVCVQHNRDDGFDIEPTFDSVVLMQFTGIADRNGVDIYEGDLIKNQHGRTAEVAWNKFIASFDSEFVSDDGSAPPHQDKSHGFHNASWRYEVEVIGNIYESPDIDRK